ncbi:MAG: MazG nucleotide pyrophosphohydrolase domain-containing protein [Pseudonocardiaceae bacterium]
MEDDKGQAPLLYSRAERVVSARCRVGSGPDQLAGAPLLAWLAAAHCDVCLVGQLVLEENGGACQLLVPAVHVGGLLAGARPVVLRGTMAYVAGSGDGQWLPLLRVFAVGSDGIERDLATVAERERMAVLTWSGLPSVALHARLHGAAPLDSVLQAGIAAAERETLGPLAKACGELSAAFVPGGQDSNGDALRHLQERCLQLYGRLEPERALAWTLEELGELSQAMRRGESTVRVEEELGQVLAWALCLANIVRVDVAHAFGKAYQAETNRQLRKYGAIHPYRRQQVIL